MQSPEAYEIDGMYPDRPDVDWIMWTSSTHLEDGEARRVAARIAQAESARLGTEVSVGEVRRFPGHHEIHVAVAGIVHHLPMPSLISTDGDDDPACIWIAWPGDLALTHAQVRGIILRYLELNRDRWQGKAVIERIDAAWDEDSDRIHNRVRVRFTTPMA